MFSIQPITDVPNNKFPNLFLRSRWFMTALAYPEDEAVNTTIVYNWEISFRNLRQLGRMFRNALNYYQELKMGLQSGSYITLKFGKGRSIIHSALMFHQDQVLTISSLLFHISTINLLK